MQAYLPEVAELEVIGPRSLRITFDSGIVRDIDFAHALSTFLSRGVFTPPEGPASFAQAYQADIENGTVSWPNGADIAPESLYTDQFSTETAVARTKSAGGASANHGCGGGRRRPITRAKRRELGRRARLHTRRPGHPR
jgi:hypothetical protein